MKKCLKILCWKGETLAVRMVLNVLRYLPVIWGSTLMGWLMQLIGPFLPVSRIALTNLHLVFPHLNRAQRCYILRQCWKNLGCTLAELPHIACLPANSTTGPGWRVQGADYLHTVRQSGRPVIFFSGHLGNWELMPTIVARFGLPLAPFYRAPNNPFMDHLLQDLRRKAVGYDTPMFPKGAKGARGAMKHLEQGKHLGILGDQKMNDGISAQFFNRPSMTAPAAAALALRFNALIVTGHTWREGPGRLVLEVDPPLDPQVDSPSHLSRPEAIALLTQQLNNQLQRWIETRPGSWLWLHRRWDKSLYRSRRH